MMNSENKMRLNITMSISDIVARIPIQIVHNSVPVPTKGESVYTDQ